jgi:hypothetical protein
MRRSEDERHGGHVDITRSEKIERELDILVPRCHEKRVETEGERRAREAWQESEILHAQQHREANCLAWASYQRQQAERHRATLTDLIQHHQEQAERYRENGHHHEKE